jgi:RNase P subunit RPR2
VPSYLVFGRKKIRVQFGSNGIVGIDCKGCGIVRCVKQIDLTMSRFGQVSMNKKSERLVVKSLPSGGLYAYCKNCNTKIFVTHHNITKKLISAELKLWHLPKL